MNKRKSDMLKRCGDVAQILKNLAHPQRLAILCYLSERPHTVSELVLLCKISQSATSQFLSKMKSEKLINVIRKGSYSYYDIESPKVKKLLTSMNKIFTETGEKK